MKNLRTVIIMTVSAILMCGTVQGGAPQASIAMMYPDFKDDMDARRTLGHYFELKPGELGPEANSAELSVFYEPGTLRYNGEGL